MARNTHVASLAWLVSRGTGKTPQPYATAGSNTSIKLDLAAPATAGYFEGYVITVDVDGDFRTTDDVFSRVITSKTPNPYPLTLNP